MADVTYRVPQGTTLMRHIDWGAIWCGVFVFMGIWSVFGVLGMAIFASASNPNAAPPVAGTPWGISIWSIVLTVIAMWVAGAVTGRMAAVTNKRDGLIHGLAMFGLSVASVLVLLTLGAAVATGGAGVRGSAHNPYVLTVFSDIGWAGFIGLFFGWLAAMFGGSSAAPHAMSGAEVQQIRPAA